MQLIPGVSNSCFSSSRLKLSENKKLSNAETISVPSPGSWKLSQGPVSLPFLGNPGKDRGSPGKVRAKSGNLGCRGIVERFRVMLRISESSWSKGTFGYVSNLDQILSDLLFPRDFVHCTEPPPRTGRVELYPSE